MMRIVHITYGFSLGGIETMLTNIANEQVKSGHEIHIIVINKCFNYELRTRLDKRIIFHLLNREVGSKNPMPYIRLNFMLNRIKSDIIHLHYSSLARFIFLHPLKKKLCCTQHDVCSNQNSKYLYKAGTIFAISNIVSEDVKKWTGLDSVVVLNGINPDLIIKDKHIGSRIFRIVQVSRLLHEKKGQHILIHAIKLILDKGYNNISLDLIGDGKSMKYLKQMVSELDIAEYVNFIGEKDQPYIFEHLCEYDLYVQPSIFEGFGLTVAEAMAAKVPVLVSENQGPLEIIDYGKYGYSFKNGDINDCANKILLFLLKRNDLTIIDKAYQRVFNQYNVRITANVYLKEYKKIIELSE